TGERQLIDADILELMTTPLKDDEGKPTRFGLGFHVGELDGHRKVGHGGAVYGFSTQFEALPEEKLGVAAVCSLDGTNGVVGRLADYALRLMLATRENKSLPEYERTGPVPAERGRALTGTYRNSRDGGHARVTELNGELFLQQGTF